MESRNCDPKNPEPWGYDPRGFYPRKCKPEDYKQSNKSVVEELQEAGYLPRENDWTQVSPLAPLWKLPYPLNIIVLTPVLAVLIPLVICLLIPRRKRR